MLRWLVPGAIVALAPKCVLCVAAYVGAGTALGWSDAEICGAPDSEMMRAFKWLTAIGVAVVLARLVCRRCSVEVLRQIFAGRRVHNPAVRRRK